MHLDCWLMTSIQVFLIFHTIIAFLLDMTEEEDDKKPSRDFKDIKYLFSVPEPANKRQSG